MSSPPLFNSENELFFFESDHLALRGNSDYCEVLKTIVILSAQREKFIKDYNKVLKMKKEILEDPLSIIHKFQNGEVLDFDFPKMLELPKLPVINFKKYDVRIPESDLMAIYADAVEETKPVEEVKKLKNDSKGWTIEEQKKLEELLLVYPPEPVERKRYQKIAKALGNRTVSQVSSRIQKYFLKLYRAGLPIPGRPPKSGERNKKSLHKHQRFNHYLWKPTTFFPEFTTPVVMNDQEATPGPSIHTIPSTSTATTSNPSNYLLQSEYHHQNNDVRQKSFAELQLQLLKRVRNEKILEQQEANMFKHVGYKCDFCDSDPIEGARWHCISCSESIDFCTDCVISQLYSNTCHPPSHTLALFRNDSDNPNVPFSDSESNGGSASMSKHDESDSNSSDQEDSMDNMDRFLKSEPEDIMDMDSIRYEDLLPVQKNTNIV
ncbi:unnamed protein product [Phaedon cochleariae]|uniref:ZZ-type domain-containing protein n=1 Tax=Phaedon cochleariae TaxID=80249 RepID=A0A9P0DN73_PHACE|nr:unnamed protein product [Phaedon cochleariae]